MRAAPAPLDVLVVGWFPGADDPIRGRFIADQVSALLAGGRVRPSVVTFEPFPLRGDRPLREAAARAWLSVVADAAREERAFAPRAASGPPGIPVARLGTPIGGTRGAAHTNQAIHRAATLGAFLDAVPGPMWPLIHAHVGYPEGAAAAAVARTRDIPLILTEHATYLDRLFADPEIRAAYLAGARAATRIICVSHVLARRLAAEFPELGDRLVVIPNTVDVEAFRPVGAEGRDPDELLWVGYRREVKGIDVLLRALRIVRDARPTTRLRLIGRSTTDEEEAGWHRLTGELGLTDAVTFEPPADREGVARAMERAALFVHASRIETMGIVAVEALASGLPVVAVDSGGVTEVLGADPAQVGALVTAQEPAPLAGAILETLDRRRAFDPHLLRAHVTDRYGSAPVASRIADLYDNVVAGHRASSSGPRPARSGAANGHSDAARAVTILVGFDRPTLDRTLASFGSEAIGEVVAATTGAASGATIDGHPAAVMPAARTTDLASLVALRGRARDRGLRGLLMAAPRWAARAWVRRSLVRRVLPAMTQTIERAVSVAGAEPGPGVNGIGTSLLLVVCLDGLDIVAAEPLRVAGRLLVAPGGAGWLADQRAREGAAALPPEHE